MDKERIKNGLRTKVADTTQACSSTEWWICIHPFPYRIRLINSFINSLAHLHKGLLTGLTKSLQGILTSVVNDIQRRNAKRNKRIMNRQSSKFGPCSLMILINNKFKILTMNLESLNTIMTLRGTTIHTLIKVIAYHTR